MQQFRDEALNLLRKKDFSNLQRFLAKHADVDRRFADEISLLSLVEQEVSNERLERPLDNYIAKYGSEVPVSNIVTAARVKFELGKLDDALDLLSTHNVPQSEIQATEIAVLCLYNLKRFEPGKALVNYLLHIDANHPTYHEWNILFSFKTHKFEDVITSWERFSELDGSFTQRIGVLGFVIRSYMAFGLLSQAQAVYDENELEKDIGNIDAAMFIADFEKQKGNFEKCKDILSAILLKHPEIPEVRWNLSLAQLASGELKEGWDNYEGRWEWSEFTSPVRFFDAPRWNGSADLNGKKLLIWGEQGVGDQLRFLTLLPNLLRAWPEVNLILEVDQKLTKLVRTWYPEAIEVWPMGIEDTRGVPEYGTIDFQIPSGSLPKQYFNEPSKLLQSHFRSLSITASKKSDLLGEFASQYRTIIGVSWRSMLLTEGRIGDYVNANAFKNFIAKMPSHTGFVILQYAINEEERSIFQEMGNVFIPNHDFLNEVDMNAVYAGACDLLVSCGTVVATMAGIFGIPVISWCRFDDPVNLGQSQNPWFPNRYDIRVMPNWDKVVLMDRLADVTARYLKTNGCLND